MLLSTSTRPHPSRARDRIHWATNMHLALSSCTRPRGSPCRAENPQHIDFASKGVWLDERMQRSKLKNAENQERLLSGARVVLVAPKHASNVGAVVRACDNFECPELHVVAPRCDVYSDEVLKLACGSSLVQDIVVNETLQEAFGETKVAVAFTRRSGAARRLHSSWTQLTASLPPELALSPANICCTSPSHISASQDSSSNGSALSDSRADESRAVASGHAALVFGREESGLTAEEVLACSHCCAIPAGQNQPSLNLSHSVAVILAQLFEQLQNWKADTREGLAEQGSGSDEMATMQDVQALIHRWKRISESVGGSPDYLRGGGGNHGRKITAIGHFLALLSQGPTTVSQIKALHSLGGLIESALLYRVGVNSGTEREK